ncbi:hypothetical protein SARC_12913 [Sphaeroforma arctica JP610]|uniref:Uncharacterized protein n=1 Tax=Sphaeroforma arctica JP610 TaxID=667725 RepID=A0A0L0FDJ1_9EUKA|nr:hypothetical protein SARC_12913 [Sphaeroforma arctica JP610]KNC74546.1 hypothetical protein SARC_12913 [Sphaeroforma arctica JP610]|eukprot:XP_014148448.1 hypothetical protein SARC_12913 [Sphaeroforma arctica JP610]
MKLPVAWIHGALASLLFVACSDAALCGEVQNVSGYTCDVLYRFDMSASANEVDSPAEYNSVCCKLDGCQKATDGVILEVFRECAAGIDPRTGSTLTVDVTVLNSGGSVLSNANLLLTNTNTGEEIEFAYNGQSTFSLDEGGSYDITVLGLDGYSIQTEMGTEKMSGTALTGDTVVDGVYSLVNVTVDTEVEFVYMAPQMNKQITIRAEDDVGNVISDAQVEVTDITAGTSKIYTVSDDEWDPTTGTFIFDLPSNEDYQFEILNTPSNVIAVDEINGDNLADGKTVLMVSENTTITFVYAVETTCQIAYFDAGGACNAGFLEQGWKACYGSDCTQTICCSQRTCLTETDLTSGSICDEYRPKMDFSTIACGEGTGVACSFELCCTTDVLPPLTPHIEDQCSTSASIINIDFEDAVGWGYNDDDDLDAKYRPEGITFSLTTTGSFAPYSLRSAPRLEAEGGPQAAAGFWTSCRHSSGKTVYDYDYKNTLGGYFLKLVGLDSDDIPYMPALLVTYNTHGSTQAAGMLYDIDGNANKIEAYMVSIYDENRNLLGSDYSVRGTTAECTENLYEGTYWQFVVNSTNGVPIKYLRIDYIGSGNPTNIGMGFDNFRAFGCTEDARVINAFSTG